MDSVSRRLKLLGFDLRRKGCQLHHTASSHSESPAMAMVLYLLTPMLTLLTHLLLYVLPHLDAPTVEKSVGERKAFVGGKHEGTGGARLVSGYRWSS
ncbi:hypothetical protein A0H81_13956 [Grifola frondosa]|uniref:Uncharacterized protein n=1 Tax=Grifola frondosa TaxID=5627 RepID=A0A1C7LMV7_GRIFR|nr:hypothetical protein A0H81_13956 [Grifola frondosa]